MMTPTEILARLDARPHGKLEREAAKLIRELMGWQDIATAPKDEPFLAWCDASYGEISGYRECKFATVLNGTADEHADPLRTNHLGPWFSDSGDYYACWSRPTHWRPLPPPPETTP